MITFQEIDGLKIACRVNDEGFSEDRKSLVFVHGSGCDHTLWKNQYEGLGGDYNIAALDLPGHGQSEGNGEQEVGLYVEWVKKIIEGLGLQRPVLVGHSLGAAISLTFAVRYGALLSGIVPVGGGVKMPVNAVILDGIRNDPDSTLALIAKLSVTKKNREKFLPSLTENTSKASPDVIYGDFLSCDRLDITEEIAGIDVPALLICGDDDKMTPPTLSEFMKDHIAGAKLALIKDSGHFVMWENVVSFNRALKRFVDSL
ncbi:MAG: alpha/beta hydrolase [Syntrophobacterales bacterium]|nr:alpha/beta hydrolase [Syntrophobacterales bacterium]